MYARMNYMYRKKCQRGKIYTSHVKRSLIFKLKTINKMVTLTHTSQYYQFI